uniref:DUF2460 domain-containing protein n=1 Tax=uncultured Allisonella sp. TaxID=339338 RepID=UPI00266FAD4E|nr:DUF2460 domain-containing protein [uncultured Allisonella sp.]
MALIFPLNARKVKWSSSVDQSWTVNEQVTASGKRRALSYQTLPSWSFKIDFPALSGSERDRLFAFYFQCKGSLTPFFYKDAEDYKAEKIRLPKNTDGSYQLVAYMHGQNEPVEYVDNLIVYVDGTEQETSTYSIDNGAVVFATAPTGTVTASYEYYWKVVFDGKKLTVKQIYDDVFSVSLTLRVVR